MKRLIFLFLAAIICVCSLFGQQYTYDFLHIDVSARASALQGSFVSAKDDPDVIFYNPASLATISAPRISLGYMDYILDVNIGSLSYAQRIEGIGNVGAGILYANYGSFDRTDELLNVTGTFGAGDLALIAGIATQYEDNLYLGANLKYIFSSIADFHSSAIAVDVGALYDIPSQNLTLGARISNIGRQLSTFDGFSESLPLDFTIGLTKKPEHLPAALSLNFHKLNENAGKFFNRFNDFSLGAEFFLSEALRFRAGYSNEQHTDLKMGSNASLGGYSLGLGLVTKKYLVDYSFNSLGKIGSINRFSVGLKL